MDIFTILLIFIGIILICMAAWSIRYFLNRNIDHTAILGGFDILKNYFQGSKESLKPILNVFLDERNFYYATGNIDEPLNKLKNYLKKQYPKYQILMHIITKNTNKIDYEDEIDTYEDRYDLDDILYIANTTYDTEKISKESKTHHLRGRDDFLAILLALEHMDRGEKVLIISNDHFKDVEKMFEMPAFNMIQIYKDSIEKRHINPSKYKNTIRFKKIVNDTNLKIPIPSLA